MTGRVWICPNATIWILAAAIFLSGRLANAQSVRASGSVLAAPPISQQTRVPGSILATPNNVQQSRSTLMGNQTYLQGPQTTSVYVNTAPPPPSLPAAPALTGTDPDNPGGAIEAGRQQVNDLTKTAHQPGSDRGRTSGTPAQNNERNTSGNVSVVINLDDPFKPLVPDVSFLVLPPTKPTCDQPQHAPPPGKNRKGGAAPGSAAAGSACK